MFFMHTCHVSKEKKRNENHHSHPVVFLPQKERTMGVVVRSERWEWWLEKGRKVGGKRWERKQKGWEWKRKMGEEWKNNGSGGWRREVWEWGTKFISKRLCIYPLITSWAHIIFLAENWFFRNSLIAKFSWESNHNPVIHDMYVLLPIDLPVVIFLLGAFFFDCFGWACCRGAWRRQRRGRWRQRWWCVSASEMYLHSPNSPSNMCGSLHVLHMATTCSDNFMAISSFLTLGGMTSQNMFRTAQDEGNVRTTSSARKGLFRYRSTINCWHITLITLI